MSTTTISIDDYLNTAQQNVLYPEDITSRIELLKQQIREARQEGDEPFIDDEAEFDQLVEFRDEVERATSNQFANATIVPEDLLADFFREEAEVNGMVDEGIANFVNWERYASTAVQDYHRLDFGDDTVYVR